MATPVQPSMGQSGQSSPQQGQGQNETPGMGSDTIEPFRQLAMQVQSLAGKFPEFTESAAMILREIQKGMTRVAGNSQRVPEQKAPPVA